MFFLPVLLSRKSLRGCIFIVVFASALVAFTLAPISITTSETVGRTALKAQKSLSPHPILGYQANWPNPSSASLLEDDSSTILPESIPFSTSQQFLPPRPTPSHAFRPDGLLQVNPDARHPILDLIVRAEDEWNDKLARASRTLPDAVREYHRRYGRAPPTGFDKWWAYVTKNNVQLPDEYNQINRDLAPFWGMEPARLQAIQRDWEGHVHSYTLGKSSPTGPFYIANETLPDDEHERRRLLDGAHRMVRLMKEVEEDLPLFRAVFSPHDNPNVFVTEEMRSRAVDAGKAGVHIDIDRDATPYTVGWLHACPAHSRANQPFVEDEDDTDTETPKMKTFIYDHLLAMDPCKHPSLLSQHGQFLMHGHGPGAYPHPVPQFSYCSTALHADIRVPHPSSWLEDVEGESDEEGEWERKEDDRLLWRGTTTGIYHAADRPWRDAQRNRLMEMAQKPVGNVEVLVGDAEGEGHEEGVRVEKVKKMRLNHAMLDIAFAGSPNQCEPETCKEIAERFDWRRTMSVRDAGKYKYVLDVDGNGWSSRFKRLMTTNALVFKSTVYPEWFTDRLAPWVHYVPIQVNYSDLYDALIFFRGDLASRGAHEELAAKIAREGREWSLNFWREEDMVAYLFRLFLEYARVMSEDRDELNFELEDV